MPRNRARIACQFVRSLFAPYVVCAHCGAALPKKESYRVDYRKRWHKPWRKYYCKADAPRWNLVVMSGVEIERRYYYRYRYAGVWVMEFVKVAFWRTISEPGEKHCEADWE